MNHVNHRSSKKIDEFFDLRTYHACAFLTTMNGNPHERNLVQ